MMSRTSKRMYGKFDAETTVIEGEVYKRCVFCGEFKPLRDFPKNGVDENGRPKYRNDCKQCYNIRRRENATKKRHTSFVSGMNRRGETDVSYTHQDWKETVIFFGGECAYCGKTTRKGERLTRDHLVPVSQGGTTTQRNIVPACSSCNASKGAKEWRSWFMAQPFFSQERMNRIFRWRTILAAAGDDGDE